MTQTYLAPTDNTLDLVIERQIDLPREKLWKAMVEPELVKQWFCPKPWQTIDCRIDLRVGGEFYNVMQSPDGQKFPGSGCYLEIVKLERLIWTGTMQAGFRPSAPAAEGGKECDAILFTCITTLEEKDGGTLYRSRVMHGTAQQMKAHEAMGFHEGWGMCLTQMVDVARGL